MPHNLLPNENVPIGVIGTFNSNTAMMVCYFSGYKNREKLFVFYVCIAILITIPGTTSYDYNMVTVGKQECMYSLKINKK